MAQRIVPHWHTTGAGSGSAAISNSTARTRAWLGQRLAAMESEALGFAAQRAVQRGVRGLRLVAGAPLPASHVGLGQARFDDRLRVGRRRDELGRLRSAPEQARVQPGEAPTPDIRGEAARLFAFPRR